MQSQVYVMPVISDTNTTIYKTNKQVKKKKKDEKQHCIEGKTRHHYSTSSHRPCACQIVRKMALAEIESRKKWSHDPSTETFFSDKVGSSFLYTLYFFFSKKKLDRRIIEQVLSHDDGFERNKKKNRFIFLRKCSTFYKLYFLWKPKFSNFPSEVIAHFMICLYYFGLLGANQLHSVFLWKIFLIWNFIYLGSTSDHSKLRGLWAKRHLGAPRYIQCQRRTV